MSQRGKDGRFQPGNKEGKGRPPKAYAEAFSRVVSPRDWDNIIERAKVQALNGHHDARVWLADRIIGKAPQILELRGEEAALLADLLKRFEAQGMSAGDVFNAMLALIADVPSEVDADG